MNAVAAPSPGRWRRLAPGVALVLLTLVAYLPALRATYIWDDDWHVTNNSLLRSSEGLRRIWLDPSRPGHFTTPQYYPLTHTTFWLEYHLWGLAPLGYHLDNILLHAASALLLWRLLLRLNVPAPWFAAAIWAVHPLNVESVAWITERKNTLSCLFYLASLTTYLKFANVLQPTRAAGDPPVSSPSSILHPLSSYFLSLALFFCALWSKTTASTLPAAILLILWWRHGRLTRRDVTPLLPFFLAAAAMGSVTSWMERHVVGAMGPDWSFTPLDRLLIASRAAIFYVVKLLFPIALSFNYPRWHIDPHQWWQWLFPAAILLITGLLALPASRLHVFTSSRAPLAAWLFFLGSLTPALGFFDVYPMRYSFVADHFAYLPSIGLIVLVTAALHHYSTPTTRRHRRNQPAALAPIPVLFLLTLTCLTYARAGVFHDPQSLWLDTLAKNPASWMAHQNYGIWLMDHGRLDDAESHFRAAADLKPDHVESRLRLASLARQRHDPAAAEHWFHEAVRAASSYPPTAPFYSETAVPHARLAIFLADQHRYDEAIAEYEAALTIAPDYELARTNLSNLHTRLAASLFREHHYDAAITHFREALRINPTPDTQANLDKALAAHPTSHP